MNTTGPDSVLPPVDALFRLARPEAWPSSLSQSRPAALRRGLLASGLVLAMTQVATAAAAAVVHDGNVTAELISEQETIRPGEPFTVGLALRPSPEWHTYWQNPGDSGLPTRVTWKLPAGFVAGPLEWPHPVRLGQSPYVTYGYEGNALLLTTIEAPSSLRPGSEVDLVASAKWLACKADACVPGKAELPLRIRVEDSPPHRDSRWTQVFDEARAALPRRLEGWSASVSERGTAVLFDIEAPGQERPSTTNIDVYPLTTKVIEASAATKARASDAGFVVEAVRDDRGDTLPELVELVLVAEGGWDEDGRVKALRLDARRVGSPPPPSPAAVEQAAPRAPAASSAPPGKPALPDRAVTFWAAVGLAFVGGLILNLMPCVFPVLSLKILGFVHVAHHEPVRVRRHGYAFAVGVLVSFWILAGLLLALRAAGGALGWGFQLQEPLFVAAIAALLTAMALNLLGVYEMGSSLAGAVGRLDSDDGYRGSFLSGVLATVLATPCTAPFMGTAVGYALVQPPVDSLAVFSALGAGMASPYLVLACSPALLRRLPRPGTWMELFRHAMAFPLLATVAWLVWVFGQQTGPSGMLALLIALLLGSVAAWLAGRFASGSGRPAARIVGALCLGAAVWMTVSAADHELVGHGSVDGAAATGADSNWVAWDPDAIDRHRDDGHVVFVDFTADWCLSCKVNERVALAGEDFDAALRDHSVVAMKADWTRADPRITDALASFGRSGVPLYVVYPRDPDEEPIVLPQVLTPSIVREALARAAA